MNLDLKGRTAFVTGASSGLGRHFALFLAQAGARVAIAGRRAERLSAVRREIEAVGGVCADIAFDVTQDAQIVPAFDRAEAALGPLNILINNAGMNVSGSLTQLQIKDIDAVLNTNLRAPLLLAREAGARMIGRGSGGRIINIASIGSFRVLPGGTTYCITKAALGMMTQSLAHEWARHGITVNAICPGYIETELSGDWFRTEKGQAQIRSFPRRRLQKESDLDGMLLLLASDASDAITGALFTVDDGQSL
ncbi:MAG TPA: SDR family NAD(P)-dependent oxidoreductase [Rhizomicrobium sp.]|nr:SDR family NAD(P)-dependent oxidoreductase [Rhizomicrobium sp.]